MEELLKKYHDYKELIEKYSYAYFIMNYDQVTDCPKKDRAHSSDVQDFFYQKILDIELSDEYIQMIDRLYDCREQLDEVTRKDIEIEHKQLEKTRKIPREELDKHLENLSRAYLTWEKARETLDYTDFDKEFFELFDYNQKYIEWEKTGSLTGYSVLLDDMEEGYTEEMYNEFFDRIENDLVPFVKKVLAQPQTYNPKLDTLKFDISRQRILTQKIAEKMGYTDEVGCIRETIHPFTNWANNNDVRVTTSYSETALLSNLYSIMHEIGHALYQLHMDSKYNDTNIFNNVTCIMHESQSRFYENYLGKSRAFISYLYQTVCELYPEEMQGITEEDLYRYANAAIAQYRRTEADELTYPLHVLIRYRVEQDLFHGRIQADGMEKAFNTYMEKFLGIVPHNKKEGVFQDSHWTGGFGYFPTYALGSAYGAMFLEAMKKDIDVDAELREGNFTKINAWLTEKIHRYSGTVRNLEVVRMVCGKDFSTDTYLRYLKDKFGKLYNVQ